MSSKNLPCWRQSGKDTTHCRRFCGSVWWNMVYVTDWEYEEMHRTCRLENQDMNTRVTINREDANCLEKTGINISNSVTMKFLYRLSVHCKEKHKSELVSQSLLMCLDNKYFCVTSVQNSNAIIRINIYCIAGQRKLNSSAVYWLLKSFRDS
jgi:hypothetical protein